jgi:hypothetical protein
MSANGAFLIRFKGIEPGIPKRQFNNVKKSAYGVCARLWFTRFRPLHFQESAYSRYRFKSRARDYVKRKRREKGHNRPLVWSGDSERVTRMARITSTNKFGRVSMAPNNLRWKHPSSHIRMTQELRTINKNEISELARHFNQDVQTQLNANNDLREVKIT